MTETSYSDVQKILTGNDTFESAFIQDDYPYGSRLRCKRAVWVETAIKGAKKGQQRAMFRTTNPKRDSEVWNKPKASTYSDIIVLYLDGNEHVKLAHLSTWDSAEKIAAFVEQFGEHLTDAQRNSIRYLDAVQRMGKRVKWTINDGTTPAQTPEEQNRILNAMLVQELRQPSQQPILS